MKREMILVQLGLAIACGTAMGNELANPGFESGFAGWTPFGNAFVETSSNANFPAYSGNQMAKMFGNFSGGFNVTGLFQTFPASAGQVWTMDCFTYNLSSDAMSGGNWAVMKIAFFDAANTEIGFAETRILDANSVRDQWIDNTPASGAAPANTVAVGAYLLFLQPEFAGGAAWFDDVSLVPAPGAAAVLALGGIVAGRRRR